MRRKRKNDNGTQNLDIQRLDIRPLSREMKIVSNNFSAAAVADLLSFKKYKGKKTFGLGLKVIIIDVNLVALAGYAYLWDIKMARLTYP